MKIFVSSQKEHILLSNKTEPCYSQKPKNIFSDSPRLSASVQLQKKINSSVRVKIISDKMQNTIQMVKYKNKFTGHILDTDDPENGNCNMSIEDRMGPDWATSWELITDNKLAKSSSDQTHKDLELTHEKKMQYDPDTVNNYIYDKEGKIKNSLKPKDEEIALDIAKNPGQITSLNKYVYHSTSFKNLSSIKNIGIDPMRGGGDGGSCELCPASNLKDNSISNSQNKIAVANDRLTLGTYINQRENYVDDIERVARKKDLGTPENYPELRSVLLRFKVIEEYQEFGDKAKKRSTTWTKDPDDKRAFHLNNKLVRPEEIECLTFEGWVPLITLKNVDDFFPKR